MKKSLLALAVLGAFTGVASAQSSVTLYGIVDANVTNRTAGDRITSSAANGIAGDSRWLLNDGGQVNGKNGSRWGLRGSEDLGGGLSALFVLEQGFAIDSGNAADANRTFSRQAYVGVNSKSLGSVTLGRQYALSYNMMALLDPTDKGQLKTDESVALSNTGLGGNPAALPLFQESGTRIDNAVQYSTPSFGGFVATALVGAGEGATTRYQAVRGTFGTGPIAVGVSYEELDSSVIGTYNKVITVGGNYNFGFAKLFAGYQQTKDFGTNSVATPLSTTVKDHEVYTVGATVPIGAVAIHANYTAAKYDLIAGGDRDLQKYGVAVEYSLSKRTFAYAAYTQKAGDLKDFAVAKREITLFGLRHAF